MEIIYIVGSGRSGSTLVDRILGTSSGAVSMNEIYRLWMEDQFYDRKCGCGKKFRECNFWQRVRHHIPEEKNFVSQLLSLKEKVDHTRFFWKIYAGAYGAQFKRLLTEYKQKLSVLYGAISRASGGKAIVDSSKVSSRALILSEMESTDVEFVHLIRDSRAVSYAWANRVKTDPSLEDKTLDHHSVWWTALKWISVNLSAQCLETRGRYVRLLYEDFVNAPYEATQRVASDLNFIDQGSIAFTDRRTVEMPEVHSMSGNPQRFDTGQVEIRNKGVKWKEEMSVWAYLYTTAVTWPFLLKYGYRP